MGLGVIERQPGRIGFCGNLRQLRSSSVEMALKTQLSNYYIPLLIAWHSATTVLSMPYFASRYTQHLNIPSSDSLPQAGMPKLDKMAASEIFRDGSCGA